MTGLIALYIIDLFVYIYTWGGTLIALYIIDLFVYIYTWGGTLIGLYVHWGATLIDGGLFLGSPFLVSVILLCFRYQGPGANCCQSQND